MFDLNFNSFLIPIVAIIILAFFLIKLTENKLR